MADYLIQDTTLDAIADAINAKTGGSSAMTPAQMVTAIGNISGGGVRKAEGTFSLVNDSAPPVFTHNLGTQKIAMFVVPTGPVVAHSGYKIFCMSFINTPAFLDNNYQFSVDISNYNANVPDPITSGVVRGSAGSTQGLPRVANGNASPWISQGSNLMDGTVYGVGIGGFTLTDDTIKINTGFVSGNYRYAVFALE